MNLSDLEDRATITVTEAAELLGVSRDVAYEAARAGDLPTLRLGARRLVVPVPALRRLLGDERAEDRGDGEGWDGAP